MQPTTTQPNIQLDPQALRLAKAIRRAETGGSKDPYNTRGASGEYGAYQYMPDTWKGWSKEFLGTDNAPMSVENQNKVAYNRIKKWKDEGLTPAQIASKWNSGDENTYRNGGIGTNKQGVKYNVPEYVRKVSDYYRQSGQAAPVGQMQTQQQLPPRIGGEAPPATPVPEQRQTLGGKLGDRMGQGSEALGKLGEGFATGDKSKIGSGLIQTGGALAGGVLDTIDAGLGLIPGYNKLQDVIADKVITPVMNTGAGQAAINSWQEFAQAYPETAKNIGAGGNMLSVLPVFKALSVAKSGAGTAMTNTFKSSLEKKASEEIRLSTETTMKGKGLLETNGKVKTNPIDTIVKDGYLPEIAEDANGIPRYQTATAQTQLNDAIDLDEQELQRMLVEATGNNIAGYVPLAPVRQATLNMIKQKFADRGQVGAATKKVNAIFDDYVANKGDLVTLQDLNDMKRGVREAVNFNSPKLSGDVRYQIGQVFMEAIEKGAEAQGIKGIKELNRLMGDKIRAQELLEYLEGRSVSERPGMRTLVGRRSGDTATIAGEAIGQSVGMPGVGAAIGRFANNRAISGNKGGAVRRLANAKRKRKKLGTIGKVGALTPLLQGAAQEAQPQQTQQEKK